MSTRRSVHLLLIAAACALMATATEAFPPLKMLQRWCYDLTCAAPLDRGSASKVVVVEVDRDILDQHPSVNISPALADSILKLDEHGCKAIGIDLLVPNELRDFPDLQSGGPGDPSRIRDLLVDADHFPRRATPLASKMVAIQRFSNGEAVRPLVAWGFDPATLACVELTEDEDFIVRRQRMRYEVDLETGRQTYFHLAPQLASAALQRELRAQDNSLWLGVDLIPCDSEGLLPINYRGPPGTVHSIAMSDLLEGRISLKDRDFLVDAVAIIGITDSSQNDFLLTPYHNPLLSLIGIQQRGSMPGAELHANLVAMILDRAYLWQLPILARFGVYFLAVLPILGLNARWRWGGGSLALGLVAITWIISSVIALKWANLELPSAGVIAALLATGIALAFQRYRAVQRLFAALKSREIVRMLLRGDDVADQTSEERIITVMFVDVRDFSTYARTHSPQQVTKLLNEYFQLVLPRIEKHGGVVNQFVGDGLMVLFNAPDPLPNHAEAAVNAARDMVRSVRSHSKIWQQLGHPTFKIGVGLQTGRAVVGLVGSQTRLDYTAVGDTVNAAARIEAENKSFNTEILIGEATHNELSDDLRVELGCAVEPVSVTVKGVGAIRVYAVDPEMRESPLAPSPSGP